MDILPPKAAPVSSSAALHFCESNQDLLPVGEPSVPNSVAIPPFFAGSLPYPESDPIRSLVAPHTDFYNAFLNVLLPTSVSLTPPLVITHSAVPRTTVELVDASVDRPQINGHPLTPSECREAGLTYGGALNATFKVTVANGPVHTVTRSLGEVPVMVMSSACHLAGKTRQQLIDAHEEPRETGGYFIINGNERLIRLLVNNRRNYPIALHRTSFANRGSNFSNYGIMFRSVRADETSTTHVLHYLKDGSATLRLLLNKGEYFIPFITIMKALKETTDREIYAAVTNAGTDVFATERLQMMLRDSHTNNIFGKADATAYIGQHFRHMCPHIPVDVSDEEAGRMFIDYAVFPHLTSTDGSATGSTDKFNLLAFMLRKLYLLAQCAIRPETPDSTSMQEVLLPGQVFNALVKEKLEDALGIFRAGLLREALANPAHTNLADKAFIGRVADRHLPNLGQAMTYFIATGNIRSRTGLDLMQVSGMTVSAERLNFLRYLAHFRSIHRGAFFMEMRSTTVRKLQPDSWGFICPVHTPDGGPIGLLQHLTHTCTVTTTLSNTDGLPALLTDLRLQPASSETVCIPVNLCGRIIGYMTPDDAANAARELRMLKAAMHPAVPRDIEIVNIPPSQVGHMPALHLLVSRCRFIRPVTNLVATAAAAALNGASADGQAPRVIEYIGSLEQLFLDIAVVDRDVVDCVTTHQELYPTAFLSVIAAMTPFSDFNQSPRCLYQCQMAKQTMGTPYLSVPHRTDTKTYRVLFPQRALVSNVIQREYGLDDYPNGTNAVVAVISYTSYDMEDACIINQHALDRGLFRGVVWTMEDILLFDPNRRVGRDSLAACTRSFNNLHMVTTTDPETGVVTTTEERVEKTIDDDGLPRPGMKVSKGDAIAVIYDKLTDKHTVKKFSKSEDAIIEEVRVITTHYSGVGARHIRIKYRFDRTPVIGDKFSSRHGQKGTLSLPWAYENMPFTGQGIVPDLIINPHAFPSRMTIGMLIESMAGKAGAQLGQFQDATPFQFSEAKGDTAVDFYADQLRQAGFDRYGNEILYNGMSGEEIHADIFIGSVYYQRLRHMVKDKFQVRATGAMDSLTRQPVKGRKKGGGVRFGEMERDSIISHGAAFTLQDRLFRSSDYFTTDACRTCGTILGITNTVTTVAAGCTQRRRICRACQADGRKDEVVKIQVPYVFTYLTAELAGLGIRISFDINSVVKEAN